jgi:hypothetical protein
MPLVALPRRPNLPALPGQRHVCAHARYQAHVDATRRDLRARRATALRQAPAYHEGRVATARRQVASDWMERARLASEFGWDLYRRLYDTLRWAHLCECGVTLPSLPATVDITMPDTTGYNAYTPTAANLQTCLNNVGTTNSDSSHTHAASDLTNGVLLTITAATTFTGNLNLPAPNMSATKWVIAQTSALASLPADTRVKKTDTGSMVKISVSDPAGASRCFSTDNAVKRYRFMGLEIVPADAHDGTSGNYVNDMVALGIDSNGNYIATLGNLPDQIIFDRCYIHCQAGAKNARNGFTPNGKNIALINSIVDNIWFTSGNESHCIFLHNTEGPLLVQNTELSNASSLSLSGGVSATIDQTHPHDLTYRRNYHHYDTAYRNAGYFVKNHFELKRGARALVEQCEFFQVWAEFGDQNGSSIQLTVRTEGVSGAKINDVTIRWNRVRGCGAAINAVGKDGSNTIDETAARLYVHDNLWDDLNRTAWTGGSARGFMGIFNKYDDVTIDHNTAILQGADTGMSYVATGLSSQMPSWTMSGLTFTNNIHRDRDYGFWADGGETDITTDLGKYFNGSVAGVFTNNAIIQDGVNPNSGIPAGNVTSITTATYTGGAFFTDYTNRNYKLLSTATGAYQAGKVWGTGGADGDVGISNYDTLLTKLTGVLAGDPESGGGGGPASPALSAAPGGVHVMQVRPMHGRP